MSKEEWVGLRLQKNEGFGAVKVIKQLTNWEPGTIFVTLKTTGLLSRM